jgi:DNA polymerase III epsilon subunit-like protein
MTKVIVIDVETSITRDLIQVAYMIYDENFELIKFSNIFINENIYKRDYYNKISLFDIVTFGKHPTNVLPTIARDMDDCDYVIGHNISFDIGVLYKYFKKYNIPHKIHPTFCTMKTTRDICQLVNKNGAPKYPKLSELYYYCFDEEPDHARCHDAFYDIEMTYLCYKHLITNYNIL